jgi:VWFA-related protein
MLIKRSLLALCCAWSLCGSTLGVCAQEVAEDAVLRVRTRVVSLDALVKEKKTGQPITDLKIENFEVLADGQQRKLSYFSREGDTGRKPLALALVFDLERLGAGRFLRRTEILTAMANELSKLPANDEVAIIILKQGGVEGKREWLTKFTRNRAQLTSAMAIIPTLVGEGKDEGDSADSSAAVSQTTDASAAAADAIKRENEQRKAEQAKRAAAEASKQKEKDEKHKPADDKAADKKDEQQDEGEVIDVFTDKNGSTVRRIVKPDGHIIVERKNKDGSVEVDMADSDLAAATWEINKTLAKERPNSQPAIVYVTDGIAPMFYVQRDFIESRLVKSNTIFNALVVDMKTGFKLALPILSPLGNWVGISIAGSAQRFAKQTGGEVVHVHRPDDYAAGLAKIVGNLTARYSLGFTLLEAERDDGQMHPLVVRVTAKDAKGHERKLLINARKGYYMPKDETATQSNANVKSSAQ